MDASWSIGLPNASCKTMHGLASQNVTGWCKMGTCPVQKGCFHLPFGAFLTYQCACLENWFVAEPGYRRNHTIFGGPVPDLELEGRLLDSGYYGPGQCYIERRPADGCKCLCWVIGGPISSPYAPDFWRGPCNMNRAPGVPVFDNPSFFPPPA
jgi:hypothetical protein